MDDAARRNHAAAALDVPPIPTPSVKPKGPPLSLDELRVLFEHLADASFTGNTQHHAQIGACLTSLRMSGWDMSSQALTIASRIFLGKAVHISVPGNATLPPAPAAGDAHDWQTLLNSTGDERYDGALDLVGTGGDGHDTFNVSTTAAIVAAGVPGVRVCKVGSSALYSSSPFVVTDQARHSYSTAHAHRRLHRGRRICWPHSASPSPTSRRRRYPASCPTRHSPFSLRSCTTRRWRPSRRSAARWAFRRSSMC